jgi:hypothetical protein
LGAVQKKINKELKQLQDLNGEFNTIKGQLGDLTLQKHGIILRVQELKAEFSAAEQALMEAYGKDAIINLETGEIKDGEDK